MEAFRMDLDTAEEFYRRCIVREAETRAQKMEVLKELVYELRALKLNDLDLKRMIRGKKVLTVKSGCTCPKFCIMHEQGEFL